MFHLLNIEWLKVRKYRTFWILAGMFLFAVTLINILISQNLIGLDVPIALINNKYMFPDVWLNIGYWSKGFTMIIAVLMIILTTNEYQYRTNRQNVIDGLTRMQFYHSKWLLTLVMSLSITVFVFLFGTLIALKNGSDISFITHQLYYVGYVFILSLNYMSFAMVLSMFIRKSGLAIIIFLFYAYPFECVLDNFLLKGYHVIVGYYFPLECSGYLLPLPLLETASNAANKLNLGPTPPGKDILAIASLIWIAAYYIAGRIRLSKTDW